MTVEITSVSWIDRQNLPSVGYRMMAEALVGQWEDRTIIGLVATSNPPPPVALGGVDAFRRTKQYRALASVKLSDELDRAEEPGTIDPGWTPPFDNAQLPFGSGLKPAPASAKEWHTGEASPLSSVVIGARHPASVIDMPANATPLMNMLIKFRAGEATNTLGLEEASSPFHVPWVWCETLLVRVGSQVKLIGRGSNFPSHGWYVNGKRVEMRLQSPVTASKQDPALTTGRPIAQPRQSADRDEAQGKVNAHPFAVGAGEEKSVVLGREHLGPTAGS